MNYVIIYFSDGVSPSYVFRLAEIKGAGWYNGYGW
jgi:hypothetical protein